MSSNGDDQQHEVLRLVAELADRAAVLVGAADERAWSLTPVQRVVALEQLARARRVLDAGHLALVRSLLEQDAAELSGTTLKGLLSARLRVTPARAAADVRAARATEPETGELRALGRVVAAGEASLAHVDVAVATLEKLPVAAREQRGGEVDAFLGEHSAAFRPGECESLARVVLDRLDPDRNDRRYDPEAFARRSLTLTTDSTGMVVVRGQLDPATGAQVKAAVEHFAAPAPAERVPVVEGQGEVLVRDERTAAQRRVDALGVLARAGLAGAGSRGGEPPRITVQATLDQVRAATSPAVGSAVCEQTGPVGVGTLRRWGCDAVLEAVLLAPSGAVLSLGRAVRTATAPQRRALAARDCGCVIPGCDRPVVQCDAHHVTFWRHGGRTDVDEMVLACGSHHSAIHGGLWEVRMVEGLPQVRPPTWVDPLRRWLPGAWRAARAAAVALGEQLALGLDPPGRAAPPSAA